MANTLISDAPVIISMRGVTKTYPGVVALADADFDVRRGEIHGLVGKNGAGKSTLMGVLMGIRQPDAGVVTVDGSEIKHLTPQLMGNLGVAYVPQHVKMLNTLTVAENVLAGNLPKNGLGIVDWRAVYQDSQDRLGKLGLNIDVRKTVEGLSLAEQTMLAIAKALFSNARMIILDEPTAVLPRKDKNLLFGFVRSLKAQDVAFVYISHHLEEIFEICDRVTIMRDGRIIETRAVAEITVPELIRGMVGETVGEFQRDPSLTNEEVLRVDTLSRRGSYEEVSFSVRRGEVVGLCGLQGSGVGELAKALFGLERRGVGEVYIDGKPLTAETPREALDQGVAYLPDDRHKLGMVGLRPLRENVTYSVLERMTRGLGIVSRGTERPLVQGYIDKLGIVTPGQEQKANLLSGGNQQKVVFARLAATQPKVLMLHEPTQGVDVRAKVDIFNIVTDLSKQGVGIVIVSSEVRELVGLCDRILVMYQGKIIAEFTRANADMKPEDILLAIEGGAYAPAN
jgi:ABC-type sugar transport system ATPase subunit